MVSLLPYIYIYRTEKIWGSQIFKETPVYGENVEELIFLELLKADVVYLAEKGNISMFWLMHGIYFIVSVSWIHVS